MKSRLPKGMGGGPSNMNALMKQAQKMQADMTALQEEIEQREFTRLSAAALSRLSRPARKRLKH